MNLGHNLIVVPRVPLRANFREIGWGEVRLGKIEPEVATTSAITADCQVFQFNTSE